MKHLGHFQIALGALLMVAAIGCGNGTNVAMTKQQEDAARHPVADPSYKGHAPGSDAKMEQSIAEFNKKHEKDKVEFTR
jgi:hypothetical protein